MANILYGVNGEGAGHSTRAKEVLSHLVAQGHSVHVASFDRGLQNLKPHFDVTEIYGFRFAYVNNRVRYKRTIAKNLLTVPQAAKSLSRLKDLVDHDPSWEGAVFPADEFSERREDTEVAIFREVVGAPRFELGTSCSRN